MKNKMVKHLSDKEMNKLIEMGAVVVQDHEDYTDYIVQEPIGQYCKDCGKPIYYDECSDYTYCTCMNCRINWMDPELATDDTDTFCYRILMGALKGKYIFSKPKNKYIISKPKNHNIKL